MKEIIEISKTDIIKATASIAPIMDEQQNYLGELDTVVGDGDHGFNMATGFRYIKDSIDSFSNLDITGLYKKIGFELIKNIKGSAGAIFGTFFIGQAEYYSSANKGDDPVTLNEYSAAIMNSVEKIKARGHSEAGDCTMLDALIPASKALKQAATDKKSISAAFENAAEAAREGAEATKEMIGRHGRAKYLGEKSLGHMDPGAMSTYFIFRAMADYFSTK